MRLLIIAAALLTVGSASAADIGRVLLASGDAFVLREGKTLKLAYGEIIRDKDVLRTGAASNLQVRFDDESIVSLRENSELGIDSFRFGKGVTPENEQALLRLVKGGLRTITGIVGRNRHQNYALRTVTATIGIRGTDFAATLCQNDCRNDDGSVAKDGLYGRVIGQSSGTNRISLTNQQFERNFGIDENFYVSDAKSEPQRLLEAPGFVATRLEGRGRSENRDKTAGTGNERPRTAGATQDSRGVTDSTDQSPVRTIVNNYASTEEQLPGGTLAVLNPNRGVVVAFADQLEGAFAFQSQFLFSGSTLIGFSFTDTENGNIINTTGLTSASNVTDTGSGSAISVSWGRWTGGTAAVNGNTKTLGSAPNGHLHYLLGEVSPVSVIGAKTGTFTFNRIGGTTPTDSVNTINTASTFTFGAINVDFTARTASLASLNMSFPTGVNYSFTAVPITLKFQPAGVTLEGAKTNSVGCTGGPCITGSPATLTVNGAFIGPQGDHIGAAFRTQSTAAGTTSSVQVFSSP